MFKGSTRIFLGTVAGAVGGFAVGAFVASPAGKSFGQSTVEGISISAKFLGRNAIRAIDGLGSILESGYTQVRGREAYLEHEIKELQEQINRLEQRID